MRIDVAQGVPAVRDQDATGSLLIIYALALGATERGALYLTEYPGWGGKLLFLACSAAVFMAGAKILDCLRYEKATRATPAA
jgi:hypothetical protein